MLQSSCLYQPYFSRTSIVTLPDRGTESENVKGYVIAILLLDKILLSCVSITPKYHTDGFKNPPDVTKFDFFGLKKWGKDWHSIFTDRVDELKRQPVEVPKNLGFRGEAIADELNPRLSSRKNFLKVVVYVEWCITVRSLSSLSPCLIRITRKMRMEMNGLALSFPSKFSNI
jgi:hypothetical protein